MKLHCVGSGGEVFLVELKLQNQDFFFDRAVSYTSRTISRLAKKGKEGNDYELPPIYFVAVLGFRLDISNREKHYYNGKIIDELDQEVLYPKLSYRLLLLPNFNKSKTELPTIMDQWMYLMKHLDEIEELPNYLDKRIFSRMFHPRVCF
ncbi:PD-(D/E)XK nuclease family transposase [Sphingobacterium anhuiense]|uniref:PD-(D/E)XK nuclease family transposase n=1 Tax=Sphingobacterium anhuiense TaxID=493780 RepID=UPI003C2AD3FA